MPRDMGVGNADTIQQRARFFGYGRRYLGYCRVFLEQSVRDAFAFYVGTQKKRPRVSYFVSLAAEKPECSSDGVSVNCVCLT